MQLDTPNRIYERPSRRFVAEFIGESAFLPVTVVGGSATLDGKPLKLDATASDGDHLLMLRPEKLRILPAGVAAPDDCNMLEGIVVRFIYQGESFVIEVALPSGGHVTVRGMTSSSAMAALPPKGGAIRLGIDRRDSFLVPADRP